MKNKKSWQEILKSNFTKIETLADFLQLSPQDRLLIDKKPRFILNLPLRIAEKIEKQNLYDPLLKQFVPTIEEKVQTLSFVDDPTDDKAYRKTDKLLHKYNGRALLICTSACAMHCRYCFRQNFEYCKEKKLFEEELSLIAKDSSIKEVILSGGDPLSLSNKKLDQLFNDLESISHVKRVRFHTRFPVGIPERIDEDFLHLLKKTSKQIWFVVHINHPKEIDSDILLALKNIQLLGIPVLTQTVLLKGINDDSKTLQELCELLVDNGILPYYLHQFDKISGGAHFEVSEDIGLSLIEALRCHLSGYAVPKYVAEIPGKASKTPII